VPEADVGTVIVRPLSACRAPRHRSLLRLSSKNGELIRSPDRGLSQWTTGNMTLAS
jgi:hypothetical protein